MDTSLDWAVAWSLVGEWTSRTIFLPPKGEWLRQGHPKNLLPPYERRSVPLLTWARACFEQGCLPSLLALPGDASLLVLPGDGMFQAQRLNGGKCRPVILHGYGGAKKEMPDSLAALAKFGWLPMAAATRLETNPGHHGGHQNFAATFVEQRKPPTAQSMDPHPA